MKLLLCDTDYWTFQAEVTTYNLRAKSGLPPAFVWPEN